MMQEDVRISLLQAYFKQNGLLLCNANNELPSLGTVGGDLNSLVALIERGEVFYSKLYKGRATYLSRDFYYQIKPYKHRVTKLTAKSREVLEFIKAAGMAGTKDIRERLMISSKDFTACMDELCKELFVTAIARERTMNANWCSFYWCTYERWEQILPIENAGADTEKIHEMLSAIMTDRQIMSLLK